jgi:septum site-determining protein MinD
MFFSLNPSPHAPYFISKQPSFVNRSTKNFLSNHTRFEFHAIHTQHRLQNPSLQTTVKEPSVKTLPPDPTKFETVTLDPNLGEQSVMPNTSTLDATANKTKSDFLNRVIVITSGKGGVGKTSITANIGMSIARLGYKTVLIDADIGLKNLDLLVGLENRIMYTVMDVFEGRCRLDQALTRDKRWNNLSLLSISKNRQRYNITRKNMDNLVQALINLDYTYILIDCPAGIDVGFINAISPANEAIIVTTPELPALRDADRVAGLLEANSIYDIKLLVNRVRPDLVSSHNMLSIKDVQQALGIPLLGAVPEDLEIILSTNFGEPLVLRKKLTLAGLALETIARRLVGYQTNFLNLDTPYKNTLQRVAGFLLSPFQ